MNKGQSTNWILTIPHETFTPYLPPGISFIKGQLELGGTGYLHWQLVVQCTRQVRLAGIKKLFGVGMHAEQTISSEGAEKYCWKEDTRVEGTQFELGSKSFERNNRKDWAKILCDAKKGEMDSIPPDVFIRCYGSLKRIAVENANPIACIRTCTVYWGRTGTGKSRTVWEKAGMDAYPKDPCSKFWDGYRGQDQVVIDEFRGTIGISHLLRWLDRYPVLVEVKGSSVVFKATKVWITSNLHPSMWYPELDQETREALLRRLEIIEL